MVPPGNSDQMSVDELVEMYEDDFRAYVSDVLEAGPDVWDILLNWRVIRRTKSAVGAAIASMQAKAAFERQRMHPNVFESWAARHHRPRLKVLFDRRDQIADTQRKRHEQQAANPPTERIAGGIEARVLLKLLQRLTVNVYWHRRNSADAGHIPTEQDRALWRAIDREPGDGGPSLAERFASRYGPYELPPVYQTIWDPETLTNDQGEAP